MRPRVFDSVSAPGSSMLAMMASRAVRFALAVLAALLLSVAPGPVIAQNEAGSTGVVKIAVIDFRGVLSQSDAARGIREDVDARRAQYRDQFAALEKEMLQAQNALQQKRDILSREAFEEQAKELQERARAAQQDAQAYNRELKTAFDTAMDSVQSALVEVVAELAREEKIGVVLFRTSIVIAVKQLEISEDALERLNEKLPRVEVRFADVPE